MATVVAAADEGFRGGKGMAMAAVAAAALHVGIREAGDIGGVVADGGGGPRALNHQFVIAEEVVMANST